MSWLDRWMERAGVENRQENIPADTSLPENQNNGITDFSGNALQDKIKSFLGQWDGTFIPDEGGANFYESNLASDDAKARRELYDATKKRTGDVFGSGIVHGLLSLPGTVADVTYDLSRPGGVFSQGIDDIPYETPNGYIPENEWLANKNNTVMGNISGMSKEWAKPYERQYEDRGSNLLYGLADSLPESLAMQAVGWGAGGLVGKAAQAVTKGAKLADFAADGTKAANLISKAGNLYNGSSKAAQAARFLTPSAETVGATLAQSSVEGALERYHAIDDYVEEAKRNGNYVKGVTEEQAIDVGNKVYGGNMMVLPFTNALEYATTFGKRGLSILNNNPALKSKIPVYNLIVSSLMEGNEEAAQEIITRMANNKDWSLDDQEIVDSFLTGAMMGGGQHIAFKALADSNIVGSSDPLTSEELQNRLQAVNESIRRGAVEADNNGLPVSVAADTPEAPENNQPTIPMGTEAVMAGAEPFLGVRMDNGANGCVEAVTKIGAEMGSPFLSEQLRNGVVYVPTLVQNAGDKVIPFDANQLEAGDIIVYGDDDHVVMYDGNGGYVGNSSSRQQVVHNSDYTDMSGLEPTKIIKNDGNSGASAPSHNMSAFDALGLFDDDNTAALMNQFVSDAVVNGQLSKDSLAHLLNSDGSFNNTPENRKEVLDENEDLFRQYLKDIVNSSNTDIATKIADQLQKSGNMDAYNRVQQAVSSKNGEAIEMIANSTKMRANQLLDSMRTKTAKKNSATPLAFDNIINNPSSKDSTVKNFYRDFVADRIGSIDDPDEINRLSAMLNTKGKLHNTPANRKALAEAYRQEMEDYYNNVYAPRLSKNTERPKQQAQSEPVQQAPAVTNNKVVQQEQPPQQEQINYQSIGNRLLDIMQQRGVPVNAENVRRALNSGNAGMVKGAAEYMYRELAGSGMNVDELDREVASSNRPLLEEGGNTNAIENSNRQTETAETSEGTNAENQVQDTEPEQTEKKGEVEEDNEAIVKKWADKARKAFEKKYAAFEKGIATAEECQKQIDKELNKILRAIPEEYKGKPLEKEIRDAVLAVADEYDDKIEAELKQRQQESEEAPSSELQRETPSDENKPALNETTESKLHKETLKMLIDTTKALELGKITSKEAVTALEKTKEAVQLRHSEGKLSDDLTKGLLRDLDYNIDRISKSEPREQSAPNEDEADTNVGGKTKEAVKENLTTEKATDEGGETLSVEENIHRGKEAIQKVQENHNDVPNAMYRKETGWIEFKYGKEGTEAKDYEDGYGISKILKKHGKKAVDMVPEVLAKGTASKEHKDRIYFDYDGYKAVVRLTWNKDRHVWLVTNFEIEEGNKKESHNAGVVGRPAPTTTRPSSSGVDSISNSNISQEQENVTKNSEKNSEASTAEENSKVETEKQEESTQEQTKIKKTENTYNGFTETLPANQQARAQKTLSVEVDDVDGKKVTRAEYVEKAVADDRPVHKVENEKKTEYRIYTGDDTNGYAKVTKTEYDYAMFLGAKPLDAEAPAETEDKTEKKAESKTKKETTNKKGSKKSSEKLEDFGEHLEGAKKDYYASYKDKLEKAKNASLDDVPFSKWWVEPDYKKLIESGVNRDVVDFIRALRDLASEVMPNKKSYKFKMFKPYAETLKKFMEDCFEQNKISDVLERVLSKPEYVDLRTRIEFKQKLYEVLDHEASLRGHNVDVGTSGTYFYYPSNSDEVIEFKATREKPVYRLKLGPISREFLNNHPEIKKPSYDLDEMVGLAVKAIKATQEENESISVDDKKLQEFKKKVHVGKMRGASTYIVFVKWGSGNRWATLADGFEKPQDARNYVEEHIAELQKKYEDLKKTPGARGLGNSERIGKDYRNGKDVTPEQFSEAFGFRGVQFGNWVKNAKRQQDLNEAFDALMDLADVLGISPRALSLGGELGLAFGARGSGNANAHYEPTTFVINLTNTRGAGSLAHEWFHALDNYLTQSHRSLKPSYMTHAYHSEARKELEEAVRGLRKAFSETGYLSRSSMIDALRSNDYWSTNHEMGARAFEAYVIYKLKQTGYQNDYLANVLPQNEYDNSDRGNMGESRYPYPTNEEMENTFAEAFDNLFTAIEEKSEGGNVILYSLSDSSVEAMSPEDFEQAVRDEFSYAKDFTKKDNVISFVLPNGKKIHVDLVNRIAFTDEDKAKAEQTYGRAVKDTELPEGAYTNAGEEGFISVAMTGRKGAISHEAYHVSREFLNGKTKDFLSNRFKNEEAEAEAYRKWRDSRNRDGMFGKIWQQIKDVASSFANILGIQTEHEIFRQIESGKVYENATVTNKSENTKYSIATDKQLEEVRKQYEGTDKWMKAPNGKPTNLTEKQWLQVRTPNFKKWFGDWENDPDNASKVVDENGEPLVVYHGTNTDFDIFDKSTWGKYDNGSKYDWVNGKPIPIKDNLFFFTADKALAVRHAKGSVEFSGEGKARVISCFISSKNTLVENIDEWYATKKFYDTQLYYDKNTSEYQNKMKDGNYDGLLLRNPIDESDVLIGVINPNQIKSATDNNGEFSQDNDNIKYSISPHESDDKVQKLYHGSSEEGLTEVLPSDRNKIFYGMFFGNKAEALSHGNGVLYSTEVNEKDLVDAADFAYMDEAVNAIEKYFGKPLSDNSLFVDLISSLTSIWNPNVNLTDQEREALNKVFGKVLGHYPGTEDSELDFAFQSAAGFIADKLGYKGVYLPDEHGTSILITPKAKLKRENDNIKLSAAEIEKQAETNRKEQFEMVKTEFPTAKNIKQNGNEISFDYNYQRVRINFVDKLIMTERDKNVYREDYGKGYAGETVLGKIETINGEQVITLLQSGPKDTISHEAFHLAFRTVLTNDQRKFLVKQYGSEENAAEAYRKLMNNGRTRKSMFDTNTMVGKLFQKIYDFASSIYRVFAVGSTQYDAESIMYAIADGSIYNLNSSREKQSAFINPAYLAAWHGTAQSFKNFSLKKIGTGEGAQAHGYGLYFTLNPDVARKYRNEVSHGDYAFDGKKIVYRNGLVTIHKKISDVERKAIDYFHVYNNDNLDKAIKNVEQILSVYTNPKNEWQKQKAKELEEILNILKSGRIAPKEGYLYKVEIPESDTMIREGASLSNQPKKVQDGIRKTINDLVEKVYSNEPARIDMIEWAENISNRKLDRDISATEMQDILFDGLMNTTKPMFHNLYRTLLSFEPNPKELSMLLNKHGIEGISYNGELDGECCVVFNDKAVKILERNGKAVNTAADSETKFSVAQEEAPQTFLEKTFNKLGKSENIKSGKIVVEQNEKDSEQEEINLKNYIFGSPSRIAEKVASFKYFYTIGKRAMDVLTQKRSNFERKLNKALSLVNNQEDYKALSDVLLSGDMEGKEWTKAELLADGIKENVAEAYVQIRRLMDQAYKMVNEARRRPQTHTINNATEKQLQNLRDNDFVDILSIKEDEDGHKRVTYKEYANWERNYTVDGETLKRYQEDPAMQVLDIVEKGDDTYEVTVREAISPVNKLAGYIPHFFHNYMVRVVDKDGKTVRDENGNPVIITSGRTEKEAVEKAEEWLKNNKLAEGETIHIAPKIMDFTSLGMNEGQYAAVMGDKDYYKMMNSIAEKNDMTLAEAKEMLNGSVKKKNRHRFFGNLLQRKGVSGYEDDINYILRHYFNSASRYYAMETEFKPKAINMYERLFGDFSKDAPSKTADYTKDYINDLNGNPTTLEKAINDSLMKSKLFRQYVASHFGDRAALQLASNITSATSYLCLGYLNASSALLNLTQLINTAAYLNDFNALGKALAKGFHHRYNLGDLRILHETNVLNDIGLDSGSGYDVNRMSAKNLLGKLNKGGMVLFKTTEAYCRCATVLAAYESGRKKGMSHNEAIEYAKEINRKSNFDYGVSDAPNIFRRGSILAQLLLQFKKYGIKELEVMGDMLPWNNATNGKQKVIFWGLMLLACGLLQWPGEEFLDNVFFDGKLKPKMKAWMMEAAGDSPMGKALAEAAMYGLAAPVTGVDISSRAGLADVIPSKGRDIGGPSITRTVSLAADLFQGKWADAIRDVSPGLYNQYAAWIAGQSVGKRNRVNNYYDSFYDKALRSIGFKSVNESIDSDIQRITSIRKKEATEEKQRAIDDYIENPTNENLRRLKELNIKAKTVQDERKKKKMDRLERNKSGMSKDAKKQNSNLLEFAK